MEEKMGTLRQVIIAAAIITSGMIFASTNKVVAGDFETCREVQSNNRRNFNECLARYNLPRVSERQFRNIVGNDFDYNNRRRYRDQNGWYQPERPRYGNRPWRESNQRRYIYVEDHIPNQDLLGILGLGFGIVQQVIENSDRQSCTVIIDGVRHNRC